MNARLWLCLSAAAPCLLDTAVTLQGQPSAYWQGDYSAAIEWNPLPRLLLWLGPWPFIVGVVAWILGFCLAICIVPRPMAIVIAFAAAVLHGIGAGSWMFRYGWIGSLAAVAVLIFVERLMNLCWLRAGIATSSNPN